MWDSGKVASSAQSYVPYGGPALANGEAYDWTVKTWDRDGEASPAASGRFETGLTDAGWSGAQLDPPRDDRQRLHRRLDAGAQAVPGVGGSPVTRARVYASAMGQYEVHVNGKTIGRGDNYNHPTEAQYYAFDATDAVTAGQPLALGALYHYWTCTCQGRANGPVSNTTLSAAQAVGATNLKVGSVSVFDVGDHDHGRHRRRRRDRHGHRDRHRRRRPAPASPSRRRSRRPTPAVRPCSTTPARPGLIMKAVVDHADGTRETFVTDGTWKISKAPQYTTGTVTTRNGDSGDRAERYDARLRDRRLGHRRLRRLRLAAGVRDRPAPAAGEPVARDVQPPRARDLAPRLRDGQAQDDHQARRRQRRRRLRPGHLGGAAAPLRERRRRPRAGDADELPAQQHARWRPPPPRAPRTSRSRTSRTSSSATRSPSTRPPTASARAIPRCARSPPSARRGATGTGITLDAPLTRAHANARFVEGSRAGTSTHDTQGSDLGWWYTQKDGAQTAHPHLYWGWRYLQILPPGAGETSTADDISAVVQYASAPQARRATFDSDNPTLNAVFDLMQHSRDPLLRGDVPRHPDA